MKRILVCEDEDVIRDFVVINLKRAGYDVIDVSCGEDALRVFDEENGNFDIALLDIMMPELDGFSTAKEIRKIYPEGYLPIDGGINLSNAPLVVEAGVNVLVAGSSVFGADDIDKTVKEFIKLFLAFWLKIPLAIISLTGLYFII